MLVSQNIVNRWYNKNHWIYRQFAYLFKNPLWSKTIPNGFSVCPYFWLALFSAFLFKPFFVFPLYGLSRLLRPIFAKSGEIAVGIGATMLLSAAILLVYMVYDTFDWFYPITAATTIVLFFSSWHDAKQYKFQHEKHSPKLLIPFLPSVAIGTVLFFVDNLEFWKWMSGYKAIWNSILEIPSLIVSLFTFKMFFDFPFVPAILITLATSSAAIFVSEKVSNYLKSKEIKNKEKMTIEEYNNIYLYPFFDEMMVEDAVEKHQLLHLTNEQMNAFKKEYLELLHKKLPSNWKEMIGRKMEIVLDANDDFTAFSRFRDELAYSPRTTTVNEELNSIICDVRINDVEINQLIEKYNDISTKNHLKRISQMTCIKNTRIDKICETIETHWFKIYVEIKTVVAYLSTLIKAKKQGWCPYIRFEDKNSNQ